MLPRTSTDSSRRGFLRNEADVDAVLGAGAADEIGVLKGHDSKQGALTGAVAANDADLGSRIKGEPDILEHFLAVECLGEAFDCENVGFGHRFSYSQVFRDDTFCPVLE